MEREGTALVCGMLCGIRGGETESSSWCDHPLIEAGEPKRGESNPAICPIGVEKPSGSGVPHMLSMGIKPGMSLSKPRPMGMPFPSSDHAWLFMYWSKESVLDMESLKRNES